ncbi:ABC transporter substrate-binding protein [Nostoc sp. ATCC 53789]|uniref:caspase, EACC1-associated type n=1 Tax=Nostoc sp. ATCC 53789 TaxID=76335 RepID=UPI000DEC0527|nr:ABC transporter substrate-binding protein [Nostoc sp. ATCC 53789]QHG17610.1 ABC transporter substrate-binding protein [Nostoc sp. ATCC 53789]RCJ19109.1 ABC transporter substrate-binding protein [Nostoc sp. ATCC 53789]
MAKLALLIGVSEYGADITSLLAAIKDVEAMQRVLLNPEMGGFAETDVTALKNPDRQEVEDAIYRLFANRQKEDLLLFYFSGHGIKDENGKLYLSNCNTRKENGRLVKPSALAASVLNENMNESKSERQVVILDCCFSGAIARDMIPRDDSTVNLQEELGGKGRAILTSSTSTQFAFEQEGLELSVYTRYLVEGIEKGAADKDGDGRISVDELHEYASIKVKQEAPAMTPKIYPVEEGHKIYLAKAPKGDPKLIYRKLVQELAKEGSGEIHELDRITLEVKQESLQLTLEDTTSIEAEVLKPYQEYKRKLQKYEEAFYKAIESDSNLSEKTRTKLKRLQELLVLRDEDIKPIEDRIRKREDLTTLGDKDKDTVKREDIINFLQYIVASVIGVIGVGIGVGITVFYLDRTGDESKVPPIVDSCAKETYSLNDRISLGEEILLKQDTNPDKEAGVKAFLEGNCQLVVDKLNSYRKANSTDPEALIYLNNAKARQKGDRLKIAVSVPIGTNPNVAKEILRGVAQAQDEVNSSGGINGKALEVAIANDDNDPSEAVQLATRFGKDANILAVVGHNSSNASLSAAPVYQKDGLVMISPTSYAQNLDSVGNYIFRTAPSVKSIADSVSNYAIKIAGKTNFLICVDYQGIDNRSFNNEFVKAIKSAGGQINSTECDISARDFNPSVVISQAVSSGANALVLGLYIDKIKQGLAVAQSNQGQLTVFGSPTLFTNETLKEGRGINGLIISAPWYPAAFPNNIFLQKAQKLWGATVNWRTATAYDATLAIIAGLQRTNRRDELQKVLHSPSFSVDGATGKIQFLPSGDRINNDIFLVKVQQIPGTDKYEFVLIKP